MSTTSSAPFTHPQRPPSDPGTERISLPDVDKKEMSDTAMATPKTRSIFDAETPSQQES